MSHVTTFVYIMLHVFYEAGRPGDYPEASLIEFIKKKKKKKRGPVPKGGQPCS